MKVWLLASGSYSDYVVIGIFSTLDLAMEAKHRRCDYKDHDPVEYEVDDPEILGAAPDAGFEVGPIFACDIRLKSGEMRSYTSPYCDAGYRHPTKCQISEWDPDTPDGEYRRITVLSPVSQEHADKVAVEKRQGWLRTGKVAT